MYAFESSNSIICEFLAQIFTINLYEAHVKLESNRSDLTNEIGGVRF